jgi:hypothetical protein
MLLPVRWIFTRRKCNMKQLYRVLPVLVAVTLLLAGVEKRGSFDITEIHQQDVQASSAAELQKKGSFDITSINSHLWLLSVLE